MANETTLCAYKQLSNVLGNALHDLLTQNNVQVRSRRSRREAEAEGERSIREEQQKRREVEEKEKYMRREANGRDAAWKKSIIEERKRARHAS